MSIALFLLAAAAAKAHAAPDTSTRDGVIASYTAMFKHIDTDGDGKVSRAEWEVMVDASPMLQSLSLTQSTRASLRATLMAGFDQNDSDKDGFLTLDELMAKPLLRFACLDTNHDAKVTQAEMEANMDKCSAPGQ
jgi:Ca2+-binding EF-hand superfamily protein